jgi:hypothetical protein
MVIFDAKKRHVWGAGCQDSTSFARIFACAKYLMLWPLLTTPPRRCKETWVLNINAQESFGLPRK